MGDRLALAKEWLIRGEHDFQTAQLGWKAKAPGDTIAVLLQQACEKYLKGYLISTGWHLHKTHDVVELVDEAISHDNSFEPFGEMARRLTAYYLVDRYPPGPPSIPSSEEIEQLLGSTKTLIRQVHTLLGIEWGREAGLV